MLHEEVTWWDVLFLVQIAMTIFAMWISYKEGEKRGYEKAMLRRRKKRYKLPSKTVTPDEFLQIWNGLDGNYNKSRDMQRTMKRMRRK